MYVRAAASAAAPVIRGPFPITQYDVKVIEYKAAIYKLQEILRIISILEKNLKPKSGSKDNEEDKKKFIIPLISYILSLCEGHLFNIQPTIKKRYDLLYQFKLCKLSEINPPVSTSSIVLDIIFPNVEIDGVQHVKNNIYDCDLQWKLLNHLKILSTNALSLYNRRLRQLQLERAANSSRPYELTEKQSKFNIGYVDDLVRPSELSLSLDFAVLINDLDKDTSLQSFLKLQWQVSDKYVSYLNKKILPQIKTMHHQLIKYSNNPSINSLKDIFSHYEFTLHRIFAVLLKIYTTMAMSISLIRQIYIPNKSYFHDAKIKLSSKNVYEYENILKRLENICLESKDQIFKELVATLESIAKKGLEYKIESYNSDDSIVELNKFAVSKYLNSLKQSTNTLTIWLSMWKYIRGNTKSTEKFNELGDEQLSNMVDEKRAVDKLSYFEKLKEKEREKEKDNEKETKHTTIKVGQTILESDSLDTLSSSSNSSDNSNTNELKILNRKDARNVPKMKLTSPNGSSSSPSSSPSPFITSSSPTTTSRRASVENGSKTTQLPTSPLARVSSTKRHSATNSPRVSRRSSVIERSSLKLRPLPPVTQESTPNNAKPAANNAIRRSSSVKGRPRSSSLQNANYSNGIYRTTSNTPLDHKRSNSLEASDALNQKLVQDTMKKLMMGSLGNRITNPDGTHVPTRSRSRSRSSSVNSESGSTSRDISGRSSPVTLTPIGKSKVSRRNSKYLNSNTTTISPSPSSKTSKIETFKQNKAMKPERLQFIENNGDNHLDEDHSNSRKTFPILNESVSTPTLQGEVDTDISDTGSTASLNIKKVRFIGVPPMTAAENPKPKRKGWYKKPAVLHYPPIPTQFNGMLRGRFQQEGVAFRTSLRENMKDCHDKAGEEKPRMLANLDEGLVSLKESSGHRFGLRLRERFR